LTKTNGPVTDYIEDNGLPLIPDLPNGPCERAMGITKFLIPMDFMATLDIPFTTGRSIGAGL
tara:strand:- start:186 stop:371 length:186 start_codon:yes stop_codon:yes gene_type:complete